MRLGIAGCGRISERGYVPAVLATPGVTIAAFADPERERLDRCREMWGRAGGGEAGGFADVAALLESAAIELLVVAVPASAHLALAEEAAAAGVRTLVEKPPAPDLRTTERLSALDPEPFVAFNRRFLQGTELGPAIPKDGWLELDLELRFRREAWGAHQVRDEALLDAGIHLIDLACHLSSAAPVAVRQAKLAPERAQFELELSRGRARISCATDRGHREQVEVRDRAGRLLCRSAWGGLRSRLTGALGRQDPLVLSLRRQLEAALDLDGESGSLATARDGATAMAVVEAARRSAALDGAEVTVAPVAGAVK
ncbi:MAG TPA: Gfo/Idh/MocA family oxidoreductase [Solirubrobacterales bacterium]|nr:Gfo/Idh/MocA family oxidoreductase [Solirubrobacterales bacterium]